MTETVPTMKISFAQMEAYLQFLEEQQKSAGTIANYRRTLKAFYQYLPEDKTIRKDTVSLWQEHLLKEGYAARTVNARISAANGFLEYRGRRDLQAAPMPVEEEGEQPVLSRKEYLRLLQAAKGQGKERSYLLVKTICVIGIRVQEMAQLTVEAVRAGRVTVCSHGVERELAIPVALQSELLAYGEREEIRSGALFVSRNGVPLTRAHIFEDIKSLCRSANVSEEKGNPRCLLKLHQATREELQAQISSLVFQAYDRLLEQEDVFVGWHT